ncbi:MAG: type IV pilus modification protein PilV [Pseudomonadota bacterium]
MNGSAGEYHQGVGLIEVLVTLLVLSSSLMALGALQTRALAFNQGAYIRSQTNIYAYDIFDRIRLNTANLNNYNVAAAPFNLATAVVTAPQAAADIDQWRRNIATTTPSGTGAIACVVATQVCTVTITWNELNNSGQAAEDISTFIYTARL